MVVKKKNRYHVQCFCTRCLRSCLFLIHVDHEPYSDHIQSNFSNCRLWKIFLEDVRPRNFFPFHYCFYFCVSSSSFFFFCIDRKVIICNTSQHCLLFQTRSIYGACCFSEETYNLNSQTKWATGNAHNIFQFLLEFSMECYYIEAM